MTHPWLPQITPVDETARAAAAAHQLQLTKPAGALGRLEALGNQLAAIAGTCPPPSPDRVLAAVFAGDHGIQAHAVSPWPAEVSLQMAQNIAAGGAGINAIAHATGVDVMVYNVGLAVDLPESPRLVNRTVRHGTADMTRGPAMTTEEAVAALGIGVQVARQARADGYQAVITGEVGIGNTTAAAALVAVFSGADAAQTTGRGAGSGDEMLARKQELVRRAIEVNGASAADPLHALASVGGLEHAALTGLVLGAAEQRLPVVVDGVIGCSAALTAAALCPDVVGYLVASHLGAEPGIRAAADALGMEPLLDLGLRLGEGTGSACAVPLLRAAAHILSDMATFESAAVSGRTD